MKMKRSLLFSQSCRGVILRGLAWMIAGLVVTSPARGADPWWDISWGERKMLVFMNSGQAETLTDVPILVVLDATRIDYSLTQNEGQDLRFIDAGGSIELDYEIETWDETGTSYVWVKVPQIDGSSYTDYIWMYYDYFGAADNQNASGVWSNGYAGVWHLKEDPTPPAGSWYNPSWTYRKKITIDNTKVTETLTNFPVLISFTDVDVKAARADGFDILFTDDDETTKLDHEIDEWDDATGRLVAWVKIPSLPSGTDKDIYIYYGNSGATDQQNKTGVWSNGYEGVYHLKEDPGPGGAGDIKDSLATIDGTAESNMTSADLVTAKIGDGIDFDGSDDHVDLGNPTSYDFGTGDWTVSGWVKGGDSDGMIVANGGNNGGGIRWLLRNEAGKGSILTDDNSTKITTKGSTSVNNGSWHWIIGVRDGTTIRVYIDGTQEDTSTCAAGYDLSGTSQKNAYIGVIKRQDTDVFTTFFDGIIDEVRISSVDRSSGWIQTEYNNQNSPGTFYSVGTQELKSGAMVDSTSNSNTGTTSGSMDSFDRVTGQIGLGIDFDGVDDRIDIPDSASLDIAGDKLTVSVWMLPDFDQTWPLDQHVVGKRAGSTAWHLWFKESANDFKVKIKAGGANVATATTAISFTPGTAHYLVSVYDGSNQYIYWDAFQENSSVGTGVLSTNDEDMTIGRKSDDTWAFDGVIDEVRISNVARSPDWITVQYKSMTDAYIRWCITVVTWQEVDPNQ